MEDGLVCGIDVGGPKKGYHVCVLNKQSVELLAHAKDTADLTRLLKTHLAHRNKTLNCIAIDGPAQAFRAGQEIRQSEAMLASRGYRVLYTPREKPEEHHWMSLSSQIHRACAQAFPNCNILETYPSAIADRLYGLEGSLPVALLQEKRKRKYWIDYLDAYLSALSAEAFRRDEGETLEDTGGDREQQSPIVLPEFPITRATLAFIIRDNQVLLGLKKKGFGAGYWNGFGGKIESGETPVQAAVREIREECGLETHDLKSMGKLYFHFDDDPRRIEGYLFTTSKFTGEPMETEEMQPQWYNTQELPLDQMWEDDRFWLPYVLMGKKIYGTFRFRSKKMEDYSLEIEN